ncbi:MAG: PhoH family protein, partial [Actinobacteria bacterium]|nr:PhoH family protein [Actinomycetota bacterium]MTA48233.1 PhoH family protein [Actinomycetota bacterium]
MREPRLTAQTAKKTYVLDTSVLLADPGALLRFAEHEVIIPIVVIGELETKRDHPELGFFSRAALRALDDLRVTHGRLDQPLVITPEGGTLSVELNHSDLTSLPQGFLRDGTNDSRILAIARNLMADGRDVVLVSKDLPLRVKASSMGIEAEEYRAELVSNSGWTGMVELTVGSHVIDDLYSSDHADHEDARTLPCHTGVVLHSDRGSALARVTPEKNLTLVRGDRSVFGLHGRSAEQRVALEILLDPEIGIVSLGG